MYDFARAIYQSADRAVKQAEVDAQNQRLKIEQIEASLYSGKGHSPKELLDLQDDVAALKRHLITLEDTQLEAMLAAEESMSANQAAQAELLVVQNHSTEQNRGLHKEQKRARKKNWKNSSPNVPQCPHRSRRTPSAFMTNYASKGAVSQ